MGHFTQQAMHAHKHTLEVVATHACGAFVFANVCVMHLLGGIVALGKFDALHIGHRELAIQASRVGAPFLLSFVGMAEVLGWEPRVLRVANLRVIDTPATASTGDSQWQELNQRPAPIVAKCDRKRVLSSWAPLCGNVTPLEFPIEFSSENYRFGYKAAGDSSELVRLCEEFGMGAYIIKPVMDNNQDSRNTASSPYKHLTSQGPWQLGVEFGV
ncbi:FAD synthetase 1, chloroplastic [Vitis vinifera]|uniref:FAD synthetase 1, chloroplastic n=1 Tax=Vitis vinifera TaxID=29760 RepID=A0A438K4Q8_VITVI|nr:FAD synthetase 1, chloroplastic [Vitis vinifera]